MYIYIYYVYKVMSFFQILKDFRSTYGVNRIACVESAQCHGVESDGRAAGNPRSRVAAADPTDGLWMSMAVMALGRFTWFITPKCMN